MARGKQVIIDTRSFATQSEATAYYKAMLNRYRPGDRVSEEDERDLAALLKRHTEYEEKIGAGVRHFEVTLAEGYTAQCFKVVRVDGSSVEFSYKHCISR
ncbi:MAG: DCL family protein [Rhodomicrobium sp.]